MKDGKSLLMLMLSLGLVGTWIYHLYDKNEYSKKITEVVIRDTTGMAEAVKDSLQKMYASNVNEMGDTIDTLHKSLDSLPYRADTQVAEISKMRNELSQALSNKTISHEELKVVKNKIRELHTRIDDLIMDNISPDAGRKRFTGELDLLNEDVKYLQQHITTLDSQNKEVKKTGPWAATLVASGLKLSILDTSSPDDSDSETSKAESADKMVVSFTARNTIADFPNTELFIVLTDPEGNVITNEIWESGSFDTKKESGKTFTRKIKFDYVKGEKKRLDFSLDYNKFIKGIYKLRLYHNKMLIGETTKRLS